MGIRPEFRWWILTVLVVAVLLSISALALDRPNVIWDGASPKCPHCRSEAQPFATRCRVCSEEYDWVPTTDEQGRLSKVSLSALEANQLRERAAVLGVDVAITRTAAALGLSQRAAAQYLEHVGRARCGWCGGTGRNLEQETTETPCPVCFGRGMCIASGANRRARVGDESAYRSLLAYREALADLRESHSVPPGVQREEVRRLTEAFVRAHAGTSEAAEATFWPLWPEPLSSVENARERLNRLIAALDGE